MQEKQAIIGAFLVDSYSLGSHWIYDVAQLENLTLDWDELNVPQAMWHKGKVKGDFTHYGDHTLWLLQFLTETKSFDVTKYAKFWQEKMSTYSGYVDGSSRETLEHLASGKSPTLGVINHDLSICGRIAPLLLVSSTQDEFVSAATSFAKMTHNDPLVLESVHFFATMLYRLLEGDSLMMVFENILPNYSGTIVAWVHDGLDSRSDDTASAIRNFGPACGVEGGFAGTIHLISKYDNVKDMMMANAKAGGDSSARGMIAGMILSAMNNQTHPLAKQMNAYVPIQTLLNAFE